MGEIIAGSRVMVRIEAEAEGHDWPDGCASFADVFGDIDGPDDGFEAGTVIRVDEDGAVPIALVVWDGLADASEDADGDGMPAVWAWRVPCFALMPHGSCRSRWERLVDPVRQIATIIGCPANADPLTDLDGLVSMVRGLEKVATLEAERDRRIDPVEHARAVIRAWMSAAEDSSWWVSSPTRAALLARVGADVLAEVER